MSYARILPLISGIEPTTERIEKPSAEYSDKEGKAISKREVKLEKRNRFYQLSQHQRSENLVELFDKCNESGHCRIL